MGFDYSFAPDGTRGLAIDRNVRGMLADSLQHIAEQSTGIIQFDSKALAALIDNLRLGHRYPPSVFGIYFELALALMQGRNLDAAGLFEDLVGESPIEEPFRLVALGAPEIAHHSGRYVALMDTDPTTRLGFYPPGTEMERSFSERFRRGYALLERCMPELAAEFRALVSEVCMVVGDKDAALQFDGGSSYMLWGGLFLNASSHNTDVAMIEVMAHESAHSLLFGYTTDEALVENPDEELYKSPLRMDPRPMDGIYHATYVSARMHWAMSRLIESGVLDDAARKVAESARAADRANFEAGYEVVREYGRLSETGRAVMNEAVAYMKAAA